MNQKQSDDKWLNGLVANDSADGAQENNDISLIRKALLNYREELIAKVDEGEAEGLARLKVELSAIKSGNPSVSQDLDRSQKDFDTKKSSQKTIGTLSKFLGRKSANTPRWSIAAGLVFAFGMSLVINVQTPNNDEIDVVRSESQMGTTVQIVESPEGRVEELTILLKSAGSKFSVQRSVDGSILLSIDASSEVLELLNDQRINPQVVDGKIALRLLPINAGKVQK